MNPLVERISGAFGDLVFRHFRKRTFLVRRPDMSNHTPSELQVAHRERFRLASAYGSAAQQDAEASEYYAASAELAGLSIHNVALADYMNRPEIVSIDTADYAGQADDPIRVIARDDVGVTRVTIKITDPSEALIEEGEATLVGHRWVYTAQLTLEGTPEVHVVATAYDRPGNTATDTSEVIL
jgi:hypothetical protein